MNLLRFQYRHFPKGGISILLMLLACVLTLTANAQQSGTEIIFYAQSQTGDELWHALFQSLRADLAAGAGEANNVVLDQKPTLFLRRDFVPGTSFDSILQVELRGRCDFVPQKYHTFPDGPLGWVPITSGHIQPFISIDCTRLAQLLERAAFGLNKEERRHVMAQAIARVLIHEWIHIETQRSSHDTQGIMKASISAEELMADPRDKLSQRQNSHRPAVDSRN